MRIQRIMLAALLLAALLIVMLPGCQLAEEPEARLRERISIDARDDAYFYNGADTIWYTDDHSTVSGRIAGDAGAMVLSAPTAVGTATPALVVNNAGVSNIFEVRDASTPVWYVANGGSVVSSGSQTLSGGQTINNWLKVAAPTAIATATPGVVIDSLGVSNILEVRDAATPVFTVNNGGAWASTGAGTHSSGQTINNWAVVAAPTAIATATPAAVIDSLGVSNILEVRDGGTAIAQFQNGGALDLIANPIVQDLGSENVGVLPSVCTVSITYTALAGGTGTVCTIGDGEIWHVEYVFANVTEDWDTTGDDALVEIGDGSDTDGLLDLDDAELQAADTEGTGAPAGWEGFMSTDTRGAYLANGHGFIYAPSGAAETIDYIIDETSGETFTAGALTVYVVYTRLQ